MSDKENYDDAHWRELLTPEQYQICRLKGTEAPFSGEYWNVFSDGIYRCRCCAEPLFDAQTKFDAGCGWPSFSAPIAENKIQEEFDTSHGMRRTEVLCQNCGCHLGHVFPDGPAPTGLRYCINSASVNLDTDSQ